LLPRPRWRRAHAGVRKILRLMLPAILGTSVVQINLLFDTILASFLVAGSISWLYFGDRFVELPLAIFGIAIATVILPRLASQHAREDREGFQRSLDWALRLALLVALPAAVGLILLAVPILASLLQYNAFSEYDTRMASLALAAYALGLPAFILIKILAPGFYSRQDTKTPVRIAIKAMLANMVLNVVIVVPWYFSGIEGAHAGLALATSASGYLNAWLLYRGLRQSGIYTPGPAIPRFYPALLTALLGMAVLLVLIMPDGAQWSDWSARMRLLQLTWLLLAGSGVFALILLGFGLRLRHLRLQEKNLAE